jgi:hypothetical protein
MNNRTLWLILRTLLYLLRMTEHPQPGNFRLCVEIQREMAAMGRPEGI